MKRFSVLLLTSNGVHTPTKVHPFQDAFPARNTRLAIIVGAVSFVVLLCLNVWLWAPVLP